MPFYPIRSLPLNTHGLVRDPRCYVNVDFIANYLGVPEVALVNFELTRYHANAICMDAIAVIEALVTSVMMF